MAINKKNVEEFIKLRAEGNSFDKIAEKLKINKPTLIKLGKEHEIEINNLIYDSKQEFIKEEKKAAIRRAKILSRAEDKIYDAIENQNYDKLTYKELMQVIASLQKNKNSVMEKLVDEKDTDINMHLVHWLKELRNITNELMLAGVNKDNKCFNETALKFLEFQLKLYNENYEYHRRNGTLNKLEPTKEDIEEMVKMFTDLGEEEGLKLFKSIFGKLEK